MKNEANVTRATTRFGKYFTNAGSPALAGDQGTCKSVCPGGAAALHLPQLSQGGEKENF